ncbi:cytochrome-c peroxidase [Flavilitoribacter nigricans DSM 23189 = NBRC 102662]|uniref:Cytochrome-c peroxidase n=2 Tax=Flavilitoribacter TaxID=2762562 RepID=A0A2D0NJL1_FLAN2|nr:cytochrome-c peroxidase [Flavilitoribacter nigricans DSM 23189 = NBRC 102662]
MLKARARRKVALQKLSRVSALPLNVQAPGNNPTTPGKVALGKLLFYDPVLSGDQDVACATCHHPDNGYAEFRDISIGVNGRGFGSRRSFRQPNDIPFVKRNAHTILNTAFNGINHQNRYQPERAPMFWDGRVESLEAQALEPIKTLEEMRGRHYPEADILDEVIRRLKAIPEYVQLFQKVFPDPDPVTAENLGRAIAAFERSLVTNNSRFDQYMRGDKNAISLDEKDGFELFKKVGCANCHNGPMFSDYKMHVLGVPENDKLDQVDRGFEERFAFRTPSLRNLRFTAPYMHNGELKSLKSVLEFYQDISQGKNRNRSVPNEQLDTLIRELQITVRDMAPIISFFNTLNDDQFDREVPAEVPSGLQVGGNIR